MANAKEVTLEWVLSALAKVKGVESKKMFGAYGLSSEGPVFFGLISAQGKLFLKTNEQTRERFINAGMQPFAVDGKVILKNFYEVPSEVFESPDTLEAWVVAVVSALKQADEAHQMQVKGGPEQRKMSASERKRFLEKAKLLQQPLPLAKPQKRKGAAR